MNTAYLSVTRLLRIPLGILFSLFLSGCGEADNGHSDQRQYPSPPPPTTSATQILSGGWLLRGDGSEPQFDTIVVLRDGTVTAIGQRGHVDVPNDSIGVDTSGKWVLPGPLDSLKANFAKREHADPARFTNAEFSAVTTGRSADLVLLNSNPLVDPEALQDVHGLVNAGNLQLVDKPAP